MLNLFLRKSRVYLFFRFGQNFRDFAVQWAYLCWNCLSLYILPGGRGVVRRPGCLENTGKKGLGFDSRRGVSVQHILFDIFDFGFWIVVVSVLFVAAPNAAVWILELGFWIYRAVWILHRLLLLYADSGRQIFFIFLFNLI